MQNFLSIRLLALKFIMGLAIILPVHADRLKDITEVAGVRGNQLVGYGLVVGLNGSGDGNTLLTLQTIQSMVSQFGQSVPTSGIKGKNVASVMVTADLRPFSKPGQGLDVTVSTLGEAKSLRGGTLLMTPMLGADGQVYAIAQGNLLVGGLGVEGNDGSQLIVNVPTVGRIPSGATVERLVESPLLANQDIVLNLHQGDFSTAMNVADAINEFVNELVAVPLDHTSVKVRAPVDPAQRVSFLSMLENIEVDPARPAAKVIVNARTGTVVINGDVRVTPAAVSHGSLTVKVDEAQNVTAVQNVVLNENQAAAVAGEPVIEEDTELTVEQENNPAFVFNPGVDLSSIVESINAVGASPADLVAILEALRQAGALRAELIVI